MSTALLIADRLRRDGYNVPVSLPPSRCACGAPGIIEYAPPVGPAKRQCAPCFRRDSNQCTTAGEK